jgi:predicted nucleic acid-binding protein
MPDDVPGYVVDASVVFKWLAPLEDEANLDAALRALGDYRQGLVSFVAPTVLDYEVGHALRSAIRRDRMTAAQGEEIYQRYRILDLPLVDQHRDLAEVWRMAERLDCGFYDASYAALSLSRGLPLLHADARLRPKLDAGFPNARWIGYYGRSPLS